MSGPRANAQVFIRLHGAPEIVARLNALGENLQRTAEKAVLRAGAKPILQKARELVPVGHGKHNKHGLLKKSLGVNVKMGADGRRTARIGPRAGKQYGFKKTVIARKTKNGRVAGQPYDKLFLPVFYSHLVEYGTAHSPAKSFIRAATVNAKDAVLAAMATGLDKYLDKYAARQARKASISA